MYYKIMGSLKIIGNHANPNFCAVLNDEEEVNITAAFYRPIVQEMHAYKIETETCGNSIITKKTKLW